MAKAKKTESKETPKKKTPAKPKAAAPKATKAKAPATKAAKPAAPAAEKKTPAKKAPVKAAARKPTPAPAAGLSTPLIDTSLAAQTAAAMLLNRPAAPAAPAAPQASKESSAFKNLKDQLAKPKPTGLSNLFGPTADQKKAAGHFNLHQQKGHNQTFGGLNKAGVPRRTNG
jgi:hypothetical protein